MRFQSLNEWLAWQERARPQVIELGLERVGAVWQRLRTHGPARHVITVGGTNGKGSCVATLESIYRAAGYRTGSYTSPHLLRYNERIRLVGECVSDEALCEVFQEIDQARADLPLTYFEFGTLAALVLFQAADLDVAVLEVGLGGRLDAVNIIDADVALISSIGLDHTEWLGTTRAQVAYEKAGILRRHAPAVCAEPDVPDSLLQVAVARQTPLYLYGKDFDYSRQDAAWTWWAGTRCRSGLPLPNLAGRVQLRNAAAALMVAELLRERLSLTQDEVRRGLLDVRLPGRFQCLPGGPVERILDVAHNPQAAAELADILLSRPAAGRTLAVCAIQRQKDADGIVAPLLRLVDAWYPAGLPAGPSVDPWPPAQLGDCLRTALAAAGRAAVPIRPQDTVRAAYAQALAEARPGDRVLVFGSFHTVAEVLAQAL